MEKPGLTGLESDVLLWWSHIWNWQGDREVDTRPVSLQSWGPFLSSFPFLPFLPPELGSFPFLQKGLNKTPPRQTCLGPKGCTGVSREAQQADSSPSLPGPRLTAGQPHPHRWLVTLEPPCLV